MMHRETAESEASMETQTVQSASTHGKIVVALLLFVGSTAFAEDLVPRLITATVETDSQSVVTEPGSLDEELAALRRDLAATKSLREISWI